MDVASRAKNASLLSVFLLFGCGGGDTPPPMESPAPRFNIGGVVSGLSPNQSLTLSINGTESLSLDPTVTEFVFPSGLANGTPYAVTVETQPPQQTCSVSNGVGTVQAAPVTDIQVICAVNTFTVGGAVAGLAPGRSLTLLNHGTNPLVVHSDGAVFAFTEAVAAGGTYNISVAEHPTGQVCSVTRPEGKDLAENVSNVAVVCEAAPAPASGLKLTWQDEFNHAEINQQVWSVANSARDQAWRSPKSVRLIDGYLDLRVFNKPNSATHYSGFIQTQNKFDFRYGYIEAKVRFKSRPGQWSAFWLMSPGTHIAHDPPNPSLGTEIDIIEHRSQDSTNKNIENSFVTNVHWNSYGPRKLSYGSGLKALPAGQRFTEWKVLGLRWTPSQYTFYLDNKVYFSSTRAVSQSNQFIMLTNEVRNNSWAGAIPTGGYGEFESDANAWMQVDWVRLWQDN